MSFPAPPSPFPSSSFLIKQKGKSARLQEISIRLLSGTPRSLMSASATFYWCARCGPQSQLSLCSHIFSFSLSLFPAFFLSPPFYPQHPFIPLCTHLPLPSWLACCLYPFSGSSVLTLPLSALRAHILPLPFSKSSLLSLPPSKPLCARSVAWHNYSWPKHGMDPLWALPHYIIFHNNGLSLSHVWAQVGYSSYPFIWGEKKDIYNTRN